MGWFGQFRLRFPPSGKSHPWNNASLMGNFWGGHWSIRISQKTRQNGHWSLRISPELHMDQWLPNLSESSGLHRYQSIECSSLTLHENVRVVLWQSGFCRGFVIGGPPDFFRGISICPPIFSRHFCGKFAPKNPLGKSPAKCSKINTTKIPDTFPQRGWAQKWCRHFQCPGPGLLVRQLLR